MSGGERLTHSSPYSVYQGVAAADIELDSMLLYVICPELMPHTTTSDLAPGKTTGTITTTGRSGAPINTKITTANHLEATWDGADFMRYPPMIRKGEPVEVFQRLDQDKLSWRSSPYGRMSRKTDRLCFEVSATGENMDAAKTDSGSYSVELNSINQTLSVRTSTANGEATGFRLGVDMKKGTWFATDNQDENVADTANRVFMDTGAVSKTPTYQINLNSGIAVRMVKKDMHVTIPGKLFINIADRMVLNVPLMVLNPEKPGNIIANVIGLSIKATKDVVLTASGVLGVNVASSKFSGIVVANGFRGLNFVTGAVGSLFNGVSIGNVPQGTPVDGKNSPDTDVSGSGDKTSISSDSMIDAMGKIASAFDQVKSKIGVPGDMSSLITTAKNGILNSLKGK